MSQHAKYLFKIIHSVQVNNQTGTHTIDRLLYKATKVIDKIYKSLYSTSLVFDDNLIKFIIYWKTKKAIVDITPPPVRNSNAYNSLHTEYTVTYDTIRYDTVD